MLSEHVRRRLERLNRGSLPAPAQKESAAVDNGPKTDAEQAGATSGSLNGRTTLRKDQSTKPRPTLELSAIANPQLAKVVGKLKTYEAQTLEQVAPGVVIEGPVGPYYRIDRPLADIWPQSDTIVSAARQRIASMNGEKCELHHELAAFVDHFPGGVMFLDLETCGFSGSMVFLAGLLCEVEGQLTLRQLFARDYTEEAAILTALWQTAADNPVLATFNGKTFDWPVVHDRSTLHHLGRDMRYVAPKQVQDEAAEIVPDAEVLDRRDPRPNPIHFDLLHHSRRRWKNVLPNCKLQTLERFLCGRARQGDIPGSEIPEAYHEFVRAGEARQIGDILHHNALDLVTLLQVSLQMI